MPSPRDILCTRLREMWAQDPSWSTNVAEVATIARVSRPTAQRALQQLVDDGLIGVAQNEKSLDRTKTYSRALGKPINAQQRRVQLLVEALSDYNIIVPKQSMYRVAKFLKQVGDDGRALRIIQQVASEHPGSGAHYALRIAERIAERGGQLPRRPTPPKRFSPATGSGAPSDSDLPAQLDRLLFDDK